VTVKVKLKQAVIRKFRVSKGWTQEKLAEESGVHSRTIQRIENDGVASIQSLNAIAGALDVEPKLLQQIESEMQASAENLNTDDYGQSSGELAALSFKHRQHTKEIAREAERVENWQSYKWPGWAIMFIGAFLVVDVILMTQANLSRTVIFQVLLPGVTIGLLLMLVGKYFINLSIRAEREQKLLARLIRTKALG
tara:strand:- start:61425 stop:62009 length:585 start_codon:yes stop_codon:yes gene_type:complete